MTIRLVCGMAALAFSTWLSVTPAHALTVSGSFSGTAHASATPTNPSPSRPAEYYDGAPLTGTFHLNIPTEPWGEGFGEPPFARITFDIRGDLFSFLAGPDQPDDPGVISIAPGSPGAPRQSLSFLTSYRPRFQGAALDFGSDDGLMYQNDDFSTLALDGRTVSWMHGSFADSRAALAVSVDMTSFQFDPVSTPVDEAPAAALLLAGLAVVAVSRRPRPATPG